MTDPLISVVIPTYNRAKDLVRALNSVVSQTFTDWEVIVVDNHSSDNTDEVVKSFNDTRIKLFKVHNHGVISVSRNLGIKNASGDFVAFLDSDDWWKPTKLEQTVKYINGGADLVYHDLYIVKKENQSYFFKKTYSRNLKTPIFNDLMIHGNSISNSSVVVRKKLLEKIGGLSEERELIATEDFDAWLKISKLTEKFKKIPKVLGYYWYGGGNVSNPALLLKNLDFLKSRYEEKINDLKINHEVYWFDYAKARVYYTQGAYEQAKKSLEQINWKKTPFVIFLKGFWMQMLMKWYSNAKV